MEKFGNPSAHSIGTLDGECEVPAVNMATSAAQASGYVGRSHAGDELTDQPGRSRRLPGLLLGDSGLRFRRDGATAGLHKFFLLLLLLFCAASEGRNQPAYQTPPLIWGERERLMFWVL